MLSVCVRKQESLIADFTQRIKLLLENGSLGNEEEYDNTTLAQNSQKLDEADSLNAALQFANDEMNILKALTLRLSQPYTHASLGAVVVTNKATFFISVSIEQFNIDGKTVIGLSEKSPLFQKMKGKKTGQKFSFKDTEYEILDIF